ncbi:MAG TPA: DEAD/DEAH box helicase [Planctomycetes bacterium]|nr:DEAD/DEAH box helicase [Planctomycetota bacterium]
MQGRGPDLRVKVDRRLLPVTFGPWFARFSELREVQRRAIPAVVAGGDVLMCSPTASGKTEAYAAPAAELAARTSRAAGTVLIVSPTRALANDLKRRLEGPMGLVQVPFGRYTGEHKERVGGALASIAIVTPEALDSLLARRPEALAGVRMVVLDEIHVLDGTARGDHLLVLLHRLERAAEVRPQRIAASATVDRPHELAQRYLRDATVVVIPEPRRILARAFDGREPTRMAGHLDELARHGFKKILVFCRSRNQLETLAAKLRGRTRFGDAVFAHHGSLARDHRERTERLFLTAPAGVCFATLTLEMGIDIGTVDYVLLADLPTDIPSLLQRIGRGSRRAGTTRCGYVVENAAERFLFEAYLRIARAGKLCAPPWGFRPSVLVQQALVLACSNAYLVRSDLEEATPPALLADLGPQACGAILEHMVEAGWLERSGVDRFVASEEMERRYARGTLHSNIDEPRTVAVVDRATGDVVGHIEAAEQREIELGGRERRIVHSDDDRVLTDAAGDAGPARFRTAPRSPVSLPLARACVEEFGLDEHTIGWVPYGSPGLVVHGLGTVGGRLLRELLGASKESGPFTLELPSPPKDLPRPNDAAVDAFVEAHRPWLERRLALGPFSKGVPRALHLAALKRLSGIEEAAHFLQEARVRPLEVLDEERLAILARL